MPNFTDTVKFVAQITAQLGVAEGSFVSVLPIARSTDSAPGFCAWLTDSLLPELLSVQGVVRAWYAERNDEAIAMAKQDHLRTTDRILDAMLVIEATSNDALDATAPQLAWPRIRAHGGAPDVPAARLRNIYTLHSPSAEHA